MPELPYRSEALFSELTKASRCWTDGDFCGNAKWRADAEAGVAAVCQVGRRKFEFASTVPWLMARLSEAGVASQCLQQDAKVPPGAHHPLTRRVLGEGTELRSMVEAIPPDGCETLPPELARIHGALT